MKIRSNKGEITSVETWFDFAPPKGKSRHWVDGRSAKELAEAWFVTGTASPPPPLCDLIQSHRDFGTITWEEAEPEAKIRFDKIKGEPRNSDLVIRAHDDRGPIAISIEAKADEPFGPLIGDALADAIDRRTLNPRSQALRRIEQLVDALLPPKHAALPDLKSLRYQLLTATAGALVWAQQCKSTRAVMVVHEFRSTVTKSAVQAVNHADFDRFLRRLAGANIQDNLVPGRLAGPITLREGALFKEPLPQLYFGLITTNCPPPFKPPTLCRIRIVPD